MFTVQYKINDEWVRYSTLNAVVSVMTMVSRLRAQGFEARAINAIGEVIY